MLPRLVGVGGLTKSGLCLVADLGGRFDSWRPPNLRAVLPDGSPTGNVGGALPKSVGGPNKTALEMGPQSWGRLLCRLGGTLLGKPRRRP